MDSTIIAGIIGGISSVIAGIAGAIIGKSEKFDRIFRKSDLPNSRAKPPAKPGRITKAML